VSMRTVTEGKKRGVKEDGRLGLSLPPFSDFAGGGKVVFRDSRVQALISKLMGGGSRTLHPVFDLKHGLKYPDVEEIVGGPPSDREFLAGLYEAGILKGELYDIVLYCPACGSADVSTRYCCPFCKSFNIRRSALIEHVKCGYMDVEEKFFSGKRLVCPKCRRELTRPDVDYRRAGVWCTCNSCGKSFDIPVPHHFCRQCQHVFTFEDAVFKEAYIYSLNEEAAKHLSLNWLVLAPMRSLLESRGFKVESPGFLVGRSGVKHMFDIVAHGKGTAGNIIAINVSASAKNETVPEQPIIEIFAKTFDSRVDKAFLIAIPKVSESGRKLASLYKVNVIEAENPDEAVAKLGEHLPGFS